MNDNISSNNASNFIAFFDKYVLVEQAGIDQIDFHDIWFIKNICSQSNGRNINQIETRLPYKNVSIKSVLIQ